ncbi:hypothetical protein KC19_12G096400 [Ceratodon purpureus]|uniref:Chlororespiratory reduction 3 n=1 Tax=Ceratodon purpureus TaxID=3225 RepID=A0A8T0G9F7_CERPU|nr:hypothetical protein KC19_12G096400 [Ceratodon purpureus]
MAASLSALLSSPCASSFSSQRVSAAASTSYGAQVGVTWRRRSKFSVGARAQQQEGGGGSERDEVSELEKALGVENRTVRNVSADKGGPQRRRVSMLDALEEQMRVYDGNQPPENKFFQTIRSIGDWLIEKTENSNGQDNVVRFAFIVFPIWFLALLVTSGVVVLPFDLPFLRNLSQHLAETQ